MTHFNYLTPEKKVVPPLLPQYQEQKKISMNKVITLCKNGNIFGTTPNNQIIEKGASYFDAIDISGKYHYLVQATKSGEKIIISSIRITPGKSTIPWLD